MNFLNSRRTMMVGGLVMLFLGCLTVIQVWLAQSRLADKIQCQTAFNTYVSENLTDRSKLADQDRRNLEKLVRDTLSATDRSQVAAILQAYLDRKSEIDAARVQVPLPNVDEVKSCE